MIDVKYKLLDTVSIIPLNTLGRVISISISDVGIQYQVRHFYNGEARSPFFFEDEITQDAPGTL